MCGCKHTKQSLKDFDLSNLDDFESMQYKHAIKSMPKEEALYIIINSVEGDFSQLSPELSKIAEDEGSVVDESEKEQFDEERERQFYAEEDITNLEQSTSGSMAITNTKHGVLWLTLENGIYTIDNNKGLVFYSGDRLGAIEFVKDSYIVEYDEDDSEMAEGGTIDANRRFSEGDFNKLTENGFEGRWSGYVWQIYANGGGKVLGKFNPKKNTLYIMGNKDLTNPLVEYLQKNSFVSSDEYYKLADGGGVGYGEIKKEKEKMTTELFNKYGVFFAFSDKQFNENKTPLKEGEKYVSIGSGGYIPKGNVDSFLEGMKSINKFGKNKVKENKLAETEILYELKNHECFYTNDYSDVVDMFKGTYTEKEIRDVYNKHREANQDFKQGGGVGNWKFNVGDKVIFKPTNPMQIKSFENYDLTKPVIIIEGIKRKVDGKTYNFYEIETSDGRKPMNEVRQDDLVLVEKYATGGGIDDKINFLYKKSNFINDDFNWKLKLLEMLQDQSIEAYEIYQSLSSTQKDDVLQELFEMDNDMGSDGDGEIETSKENLGILLEDAKKGKKYAQGGGVGEKKYYVIDDNNNGYWKDELSDREKQIMKYNPKTDVWHTRRNYEDYYFNNRTTNPRKLTKGGGVGDEEFIVHGTYTVSNSGGYEIMLSDSGDAARVRDAFGSDNPKTSDWLEIEYITDEDGEPDEEGYLPSEPIIDPNGYNIPLNMVMRVSQFNNGGGVGNKSIVKKIYQHQVEEINNGRGGYFNSRILDNKDNKAYLHINNISDGKVKYAIESRSRWSDVGSSYSAYDKDFTYLGSADSIRFKSAKQERLTKSDFDGTKGISYVAGSNKVPVTLGKSYWDKDKIEYATGGGVGSKLKIKDWYIKNYATDDLGEELNDESTFEDLWNDIPNVYDIIGVGDSLVRERLFEYLSKIKGVEYDYVYNKWLESDNYAQGGSTYAGGGSLIGNVTSDDIVTGKKYKYLHEPNTFITLLKRDENSLMFTDEKGDWISIRNSEVPTSVYDYKTSHNFEAPMIISIEEIESKIGRKINSWKDDFVRVGGELYKKVYLRPEYKKI